MICFVSGESTPEVLDAYALACGVRLNHVLTNPSKFGREEGNIRTTCKLFVARYIRRPGARLARAKQRKLRACRIGQVYIAIYTAAEPKSNCLSELHK